jgi:hypothetical protein
VQKADLAPTSLFHQFPVQTKKGPGAFFSP